MWCVGTKAGSGEKGPASAGPLLRPDATRPFSGSAPWRPVTPSRLFGGHRVGPRRDQFERKGLPHVPGPTPPADNVGGRPPANRAAQVGDSPDSLGTHERTRDEIERPTPLTVASTTPSDRTHSFPQHDPVVVRARARGVRARARGVRAAGTEWLDGLAESFTHGIPAPLRIRRRAVQPAAPFLAVPHRQVPPAPPRCHSGSVATPHTPEQARSFPPNHCANG